MEPVSVSDDVTYGKDSLYTLSMVIQDMIPVGGAIQVIIPKEIQLNGLMPGFIGTCSKWTCTFNETTRIITYSVDQ